MLPEIVQPILQALTAALGVPVSPIGSLPAGRRREALLAVSEQTQTLGEFGDAGRRYLACRYDRRSDAVAVLGPYRGPSDPAGNSVMLDADALERARRVLVSAATGLRQASQRERERLELASQLEVVGRSVLAVTAELDIGTVLRRIVDLARELAGARYAALGVPGPRGDLEAFLTAGLSVEEELRIGPRPRGHGILGLLLREPKTIRLADLGEHPASAGFPPNHPPMKSFLGVPIIARGRVLGNLYLTEKRAAAEFTAEDARLVELLARHAAVAIENAQLYKAVEAQQQRLRLIVDQLPEATLVAEPDPGRLTLANTQASHLLGWEIAPPVMLSEFFERNTRFNAAGAALAHADIPLVRSLRDGEVIQRAELRLSRPDGSSLTILVNSAPLRDAAGRIVAAIAVFQDITQIKDAEQLKDDFLSLVSHELRTPLTTIQGGATMLLRDRDLLDADLQHEILADISSEGRRLANLIENMVSLANIRAGRLHMETEPLRVGALLEGAVAAARQLEPDRAFALTVEPQLLASADPGRIDQVVRNLINNAIKYSPPGSPIEISAVRADDSNVVQIAVRDHGPGISEADFPYVFERFHRTQGAIAGGAPGMGLGLYLSRNIIEAHGGRIWIERPPDGGTCVAFSLPVPSAEE